MVVLGSSIIGKHPSIHLPLNIRINKQIWGVTIKFSVSSSINSSDGPLGCKLLRLSHVYLIEDELLRFCHVVHEEVTVENVCLIILI